jgi:cell division protein FtsW
MAAKASVQQKAQPVERSRSARARLDYTLILAVAALVVIGLMMTYSATFDWSYQEHGNSFFIASRQFLWVGLGVIAMVAVAFVPYDWWQQAAVPIMGVTLLLLVSVLIVGEEVFGARRSFLGGSIQPGELAKLTMIIYVATWLASKGDQIRDVTYGLVPFAVLIGVVAGLIVAQPDVSTSMLIVLTALAMFFFAGADILQLAVGCAISVITFFILINKFPHAKTRLTDWLDKWGDPTRVSYHIRQALIALGSGGPFGVGLGASRQKLGYLPTPHTDSIFAVLGEELGFVGCLLVIGLFVLLAYRGFKIAREAPDAFAALLACGVTCWLVFQALINVAVVTGLLPFTGMALPFISSGGSSMVVSLAGVGVLLSISRGKRIGRRTHKRAAKALQPATLDRRWGNRGARLSRPGRRTGGGRGSRSRHTRRRW